jgi:hypothetical protein
MTSNGAAQREESCTVAKECAKGNNVTNRNERGLRKDEKEQPSGV